MSSISGNRFYENIRRGMGHFFSWWLAEARQLLPTEMVKWLSGGERRWLALEQVREDVDVHLLTGSGHVQKTVRLAPEASTLDDAIKAFSKEGVESKGLPVGLIVPEELVFERTIEIPKDALSNLQVLITDEMSRRTPFKIDKIFLDTKVERHPLNRARRVVRQRILRRDLIESRCESVGVGFETVQFIATPTARTSDDLIDLRQPLATSDSTMRTLLVGLVVLGIILIAANLGIRWHRQESTLAAIETRLVESRAKAIEVRKILDQIASEQAAVRSMVSRKSGPNALQVWEDVSALLPDSSWLTDLQVSDRQLSIGGYADNAAVLVPLLSRSTLLTKVALSSPTIAGDGSIERFTITAALRQDVPEPGGVSEPER
ncbi:PilN domain-containing protein [Rhizobium laguerreae]|uniref:PilN domain-containing protein n=1 Tax=Rhizobium laguerreae TaxID=1076926 RepID=UPI001C9128A0|nr:PilN domain-containing protein [Rhizobium laguerreae]